MLPSEPAPSLLDDPRVLHGIRLGRCAEHEWLSAERRMLEAEWARLAEEREHQTIGRLWCVVIGFGLGVGLAGWMDIMRWIERLWP